MEALFVSALVVAIAEIGDKTQLLAIILATRFKKPVPIILGILVATLANHALAATAGYWVSDLLSGKAFQWAIALSFIAMAAWALIPDKADDEDGANVGRYGVFLTTTIAFFLVEMGDKTQIATVALGAKFHSIVWVAAGTTLGMMLANIPAVYLGEAATKIVPLKYVRIGAAVIFLGLGLWGIAQAAGLFR
ncbi:MAG: TMEM165/GDT1 family protein [Alphaproteobacteria bacterium]|nr:TMEM165/GDT1 family protein [Alphaproteobacteria bacterium]